MYKKEFEGRLASKLSQMDGSDAKAFLAYLLQQKNLMSLVLNSLHEGVLVLKEGLEVIFYNDAAKEQLAIQQKPSRKQSVKKITEIIRHSNFVRLLEEFAIDEAPRENIELDLPTSPIRHIAVSCFWTASGTADNGDGRFAVVTVRDIGRERSLEQERHARAQANTMRTLAMGLAHEIKNPLNSMKLHAQVLKRETDSASFQKLNVDRIGKIADVLLEEIERLGHVITEFNSAVRPTNPLIEKTNISTIAERVYNLMLPEATEAEIRLNHNLDYDLPVMELDPNQISMMLVNLLKNSFDAVQSKRNETSTDSHYEGCVNISTRLENEECIIDIEDNGCGFDVEMGPQIFEPYFTTKAAGTGLGLAIVARIVREHGGQIKVSSQKGLKTSVSICLPILSKPVRLLGHQML